MKNDMIDNKLRWDLLPLTTLEDVVKVYTAGAEKYGENTWQALENGYNRYKGALLRHLIEFEKGNVIDQETGCKHLAQVVWNAIAMLHISNGEPQNTEKPTVADPMITKVYAARKEEIAVEFVNKMKALAARLAEGTNNLFTMQLEADDWVYKPMTEYNYRFIDANNAEGGYAMRMPIDLNEDLDVLLMEFILEQFRSQLDNIYNTAVSQAEKYIETY